MTLFTGFLFVVLAGFFQGTFVLPMTMTKKWSWEHTWATFSLFGMLVFNWILAFLFLPGIFSIYRSIPFKEILILILFGAGWGIGAILFGLGMDRLGMALGYPIIMGLIASLGVLIPLIVFFPSTLSSMKGLVLLAGTALVIGGIILCSTAGSRRQPTAESGSTAGKGAFFTTLIIAIAAGILSCLPNVGMAFGRNVTKQAAALGISPGSAANAVWALFFSVGFVVNISYCLYLMIKQKTFRMLGASGARRNVLLGVLMAAMWIGSFYLYGISAVKLGKWGIVVGWPLFISLSIVFGNLWGIWRGEWKSAPQKARSLLNWGLFVLLAAVIIVAVSNSL